jgi:hypothetical protein
MLSHKGRWRGQVEVTGAIIAVGVLLLVVTTLFYSIIQLQQATSDVFAKRASFESERSLERVSVIYDPEGGLCVVKNAGGVDVEVARVWVSDSDFIEEPEAAGLSATIRRGESISFALDTAPVAVVTRRGNVFEVRSECLRQAAMARSVVEIIYGGVGGFILSQNIIGAARLTSDQACIVYEVYSRDSKVDNAVLVYRNETGWIYHKCDPNNPSTYGWRLVTQSSVSIEKSDLDTSQVNEAVIAINASNRLVEIGDQRSGLTPVTKVRVNLTLYNVTRISSNADVITVFYKFVIQIQIQGEAPPHQVSYNPRVALIALGSSARYGAPGSIAVSSRQVVGVVSGYVVLPRYFYNFQDDYYSVEIVLEIDTGSAAIRIVSVRLEYIAITGAEVLWKPLH